MDEFIEFVNSFYGKNKSTKEILQQINKYNKEHQYSIKSEWLKDKRILFNDHTKENINLLNLVKQILDNKISKNNLLVDFSKQALFPQKKSLINDSSINDSSINDQKNKNDSQKSMKFIDFDLLKHQEKYINKYKDKIESIPLINEYKSTYQDDEVNITKDRKVYRDYKHMEQKTGFNPDLIYYSYICYFKSAINCIIHHPLFKYENKYVDYVLDTETPYDPSNKYLSISDILQQGGSILWQMLQDKRDILDIVEEFNRIHNNKYLIGTPRIKYYPHQILENFLKNFDNYFSKRVSCNSHFVQIIDDWDHKDINYEKDVEFMDDRINEIITKCNNDSIFIAPIINNPLDCYTYTNIREQDDKYEYVNELNITADNNLKDIMSHELCYCYRYNIDDYYLTSCCVIEYNKIKGITFHCIYVQFKYDANYEVVKINRYDDRKLNYRNIKDNENYEFLKSERKIFHKKGIMDYYDSNNGFKICLLCYVKKEFIKTIQE